MELASHLDPASIGEIADLLLADPSPRFVRGTPLDPNKGNRSLYGEVLHLRGVHDQDLAEITEEEAKGLAFANVSHMTNFRHSLVDHLWRNTSETRPELVVNRTAACLVAPKLILGANAEVIITLGEMADTFTKRSPTTIDFNWRSEEAQRARSRAIIVKSYIHESESMPTWYAHHPIHKAYEQFGSDVAEVAALVANELQLLPGIPIDPTHHISIARRMWEEGTVIFAENIRHLFYIHQFQLPNRQPLTLFHLINSTNRRLKAQGIDPTKEAPKLKVFDH